MLGNVPSYELLISAMRTREPKQKAPKAKNGLGIYVKGKNNENYGNRNFKMFENSDQKRRNERAKDGKHHKKRESFFHCGKLKHGKRNIGS